jgi:hypothetical protein
MPVPQEVPFGWLLLSVQTGAPVVQVIAPARHGFPVRAQAVPAAQAPQVPLLQTIPGPQTVPLAWGCVVATQPGPPGPQVVVPT